MKCRKCKKKLKETPQGFDAFSFLTANPVWCENKKCEDFGYVVMVGIPEEDLETKEK